MAKGNQAREMKKKKKNEERKNSIKTVFGSNPPGEYIRAKKRTFEGTPDARRLSL